MITIANSKEEFDRLAALRAVEQIMRKPTSVIALSTGRTTLNVHKQIVDWCKTHPIDISRVTFVGVDEVTGVDRDYSGACYAMLKSEIVDPLGIDDRHFLMLPTRSHDFNADIAAFSRRLCDLGGIDLLFLGIGENGHLGFNQPGTPFGSTIRLSNMDEQLEARIRRETATPAGTPLGGITLGLKDMMHARRIVLLAKGDNKASIVSRAIAAPVAESLPATILQLHPCCEYLLDSHAAALILMHNS